MDVFHFGFLTLGSNIQTLNKIGTFISKPHRTKSNTYECKFFILCFVGCLDLVCGDIHSLKLSIATYPN